MYYSVSQTSTLLGVHPQTMRRWDREGKIRCMRTPEGHRRIHTEEIQRIIEGKNEDTVNANERLQSMVEYLHMTRRRTEVWIDRWK